MSPWGSQVWIEHWGPGLFHAVLWPLTCLGVWALRPPQAAGPRLARLGFIVLGSGVALGIALIVAGLLACEVGQPAHVWNRLLLFGGLFVVIHGSMLAAQVYQRRGPLPAHRGDRS